MNGALMGLCVLVGACGLIAIGYFYGKEDGKRQTLEEVLKIAKEVRNGKRKENGKEYERWANYQR